MTKPFLRWVGGKTRCLPFLLEHAPKRFNRYFEPFLGGGALFFRLSSASVSSRSVLSDTNPALIDAFLEVQRDVEGLICRLERHQSRHCPDYYYQVRAENPQGSEEAAARMVYLNRTAFSGLWRTNKDGQMNTPIGTYEPCPDIVRADLLRATSKALQGAEISYQGYEQIDVSSGDFVYFDPPYVPVEHRKEVSYVPGIFGEESHVELRDFAVECALKGATVLISNSDTPWARELYKDFEIASTSVKREFGVQSSRGVAAEILAILK